VPAVYPPWRGPSSRPLTAHCQCTTAQLKSITAHRLGGGNASTILPIDFSDREGYVSLFDGVSLKGWDGNPKFWHVENGAIVGKSSAANPSGNSYILCRDIEAHDFTLKIEIRIDGTAGTGIQCRSKTN